MKKLLSILLCVAMLTSALGLFSVVAETTDGKCSCSHVPIVRLYGGHGALYSPSEDKWYYGVDKLENLTRDLMPKLEDVKNSLWTLNPSKVVESLVDAFFAWVGPLEMNPDGTSVKDLIRPGGGDEEINGKNHSNDWTYSFPFDWRQSPFDIAEDLNEYIQKIKAKTGHDHVHIQCMSGSGSLLLAYTDIYVNQVIDRGETPDAISVLFGQATGFGTQMVGNFLKADYTLNAKNLGSLEYLYALNLEGEQNDSLLGTLKKLYNVGILDAIAIITSFLPQEAFDMIYEGVTRKTYAAWPGMWSWCPPDDYAEARARLIKGHPEYKELGFLDKIDRYYELQTRASEVLKKANEHIKVANIIGYDIALLPVGSDYNSSSDGMVTVEHGSLGAISANFGKKLPPNYKQKIDDGHNHISPDRKIDASTCALPENTWFMKGVVHRGFYSYGGWYNWWREAPKGEDTVFDNPDFPQFVEIDDKSHGDSDMVLTPVQAEPVTFMSYVTNFWDMVLAILRNLASWYVSPWKKPAEWLWGIWF